MLLHVSTGNISLLSICQISLKAMAIQQGWAFLCYAIANFEMTSKKVIRCARALDCLKELFELYEEEEKRKKPRFWVNPFLNKRQIHDLEAHLLKDILWEDGEEFENFSRMSIGKFEELLSLVRYKIEKRDTVMRSAISARLRLAITLRYLATGDSFRSLEFLARISRKTISAFLPEVLQAIIDALQKQYLKTPKTEHEWQPVADDFEKLWQFPHTLGAIDGKHIRIKAPPHSGSDYFNYRGFFSIVLLGVVDAHSRFIYVDIGGNGRASDVVVYKNCSLYQALITGELNLPAEKPLSGKINKTPYFFIGDDIFGLNRNMMKAYNRNLNLSASQEAFNYRLSRARMTVEMAFGRLVSHFRVFHRPIETSVDTCDLLVKACCILHNFLTKTRVDSQIPGQDHFVQDLPKTILSLPAQEQLSYKYVCEIRENVRKYCVTDGDVAFQSS